MSGGKKKLFYNFITPTTRQAHKHNHRYLQLHRTWWGPPPPPAHAPTSLFPIRTGPSLIATHSIPPSPSGSDSTVLEDASAGPDRRSQIRRRSWRRRTGGNDPFQILQQQRLRRPRTLHGHQGSPKSLSPQRPQRRLPQRPFPPFPNQNSTETRLSDAKFDCFIVRYYC